MRGHDPRPALRSALVLLTILTILSTSAARAEIRLVLEGATVHPVSGPPIEDGEVIVDDQGYIVHVGPRDSGERGARREALEVVDLSGMHLYPGLIAATSSLGLTEISSVPATNDVEEMGEHNARLHAYRAVNPDSELIPVARANGITHANVVPGGAFVRGHGGLLALEGWTWEDRLVEGPTGLHLDWPSMRLRRGEGRRGGSGSIREQVEAREESLRELDDRIDEVRAYLRARDAIGEKGAGHAGRDLELEAWRPVVEREIPLMVHADDPRQIRAAIAWCEEQDLRMVLVGGRDAHRMADEIAAADVPVILEDVMTRPAHDDEGVYAGYERAVRLHEAGVLLAISVGSGSWADTIARNLPVHAGMARAHGLPARAALATVTLAPARILGVDDRMGSLERGKRAHLVAVRGDILDIRAPVERMWIDGREVDLSNRHSRLFERYRSRPRSGSD